MKLDYKSIINYIKNIITRQRNVVGINKLNHEVRFINDGDELISLPKITHYEAFTNKAAELDKQAAFINKPTQGGLFRAIVYYLFTNNNIKKNKSIIDIGCRLGDNTLVWAKFLEDEAKVFAIDPSRNNLNFASSLAKENQIDNILWIESACAEKMGIPLKVEGNVDRAVFSKVNENGDFISNTLDNIVGVEYITDIGLMHIAVAGFEKDVIAGAKEIIQYSKPVIIFEQHIMSEDVKSLAVTLKEQGYRIFMINEILMSSLADCRNFIAFPSDSVPDLPMLINHVDHVKAILDQDIIEVYHH